jgi:hypothetical protein
MLGGAIAQEHQPRPDQLGHEWRPEPGGLVVCWLCEAVRETPDARATCPGSAAEPHSIEGWQ